MIYNMDCREGVALIPDNSVDILLTDPPFGVSFRSNMSTTPEGKHWARDIENDDDLEAALALFEDAVTPLLQHKAKDEFEAYIFTKWSVLPEWMELIASLPDFDLKMLLVWNKSEPGLGDVEYNWGCGHEMILYCKRGKKPLPYRRGGVLSYKKVPHMHIIHPTEKPVSLLTTLLEMSGKAGDMVVDLFSGSGSTSLAARNLDMNSIAFEIDSEHHRRSLERLSQGTLFS